MECLVYADPVKSNFCIDVQKHDDRKNQPRF